MKTVLAFTALALVSTLSTPAAHAGSFALYGAYWETDELAESAGVGARLGFSVAGDVVRFDLRAGYFPDLTEDFSTLIEDRRATGALEIEAIPLEAGIAVNLGGDGVNPYLGAGVSYFRLDSNLGEISDEVGYYGVAGLEFGRKGGGIGFFVEAIYRSIEGTVEVDPEDFEEIPDIEVVEDVDLDLSGFGVNAGFVWRW
jgi:Outer membrane protein beta-barrel domain